MADMSNVDSEKIRSTVNQLDGIVESIAGCVNKFSDAIETLNKGWESPVKADFMARYQNDRAAMQEMLDQYREISAQLLDTAEDFERTEEEILGNVRSLG